MKEESKYAIGHAYKQAAQFIRYIKPSNGKLIKVLGKLGNAQIAKTLFYYGILDAASKHAKLDNEQFLDLIQLATKKLEHIGVIRKHMDYAYHCAYSDCDPENNDAAAIIEDGRVKYIDYVIEKNQRQLQWQLLKQNYRFQESVLNMMLHICITFFNSR